MHKLVPTHQVTLINVKFFNRLLLCSFGLNFTKIFTLMLQLIQALQTNNIVAQLWTHTRLVVDSTITPVEEITLCDPSTIETEEHIKELTRHDPSTLNTEGYHSWTKLPFALFGQINQPFALLPKLNREMPLFWKSSFSKSS